MAGCRPRRPRRAAACRGSVYLLVLSTSFLVVVLGLAGLMTARLTRGATTLRTDAGTAASLARAGMVAAGNRLGLDPAAALAGGEDWSAPVVLGGGSIRTRITAEPGPEGTHRVRVRAAAGAAVRVLEAVLTEPPRLGPERLRNPGFAAGFSPTRLRGDEEADARLLRDGDGVRVELEDPERRGDGIEQTLRGGFEEGRPHRITARVRMGSGWAALRFGVETRTPLVVLEERYGSAWVGPDWVEAVTETALPAPSLLGTRSFYVEVRGDTEELEVASLSLRELLPARPAELVPGTLRWLPDEPLVP